MTTRNLILGAFILVTASGVPTPRAKACSAVSTYNVSVGVPLDVYDMPLEGIIVLHINAGSGAGASMRVLDSAGIEVRGTNSQIVLSEGVFWGGAPSHRRDALIVWRATDPIEPGMEYEVLVDTLDGTETFTALSRTDPYEGAPTPTELSVRAIPTLTPIGFEFSCRSSTRTGECPSCRYTNTVDAVSLLTAWSEAADEPFVIQHLRTETPSEIVQSTIEWTGRPSAGPSLSMHAGLGKYCVWLEAENLVTGARTAGETICLDEPERATGGDGCSVSRGTSSTAPSFSFGLMLACGLVLRRRRLREVELRHARRPPRS